METFTDSLIINVKGEITHVFLFLPWLATTLALACSLQSPWAGSAVLARQSLPSHGQGTLLLSAPPGYL